MSAAGLRAAEGPVDLLGLSREQLAVALGDLADRPFRVEQIHRGIHRRGAGSFDELTDLSLDLRRRLAERFRIGLPVVSQRETASDGTTKYVLRLADGATVEAVDIPDRDRRTLCLSSQAGCALACAFCVTGFWGAGRNLTAGEIVGQVLLLRRLGSLPEGINLVFMGMGEPLLNLDGLFGALDLLEERISLRRITVSTAGHVPGLDALGARPRRPNLAISLHAPDDVRRSRIMPINRTWPLDELFAALARFPLEPRRRITFEYLLLAGFNDSPADADALARRLRGLPSKVNLIPLNPDPVLPEWMRPPSEDAVCRFRDRVESHGLTATVRRQRGHDVAAACGQLRAADRNPHGRAARRRVSDAP